MNMSFFQSLMMGLVSGMAEMLPVSAEAHRAILRTFFGSETDDPVFRLMVHLGCLIALLLFYNRELQELSRAKRLMKIPARRRKNPLDPSWANTARLLRGATMVMVICRLFTLPLDFIGQGLNLLAIPLAVNGIFLLIPAMVRSGNMNSRNMPRVNGALMGLGAGLGVVPGISPVAGAMSLGMWTGVDRRYALRFSHFLLIPGLGVEMVFDIARLVLSRGAAFSGLGFLFAILGGCAAYFAARFALKLANIMAEKVGFTGFAYYSWGAALLCFVLFLMI